MKRTEKELKALYDLYSPIEFVDPLYLRQISSDDFHISTITVPSSSLMSIQGTGKELLKINSDGTVDECYMETATEAGKMFVDSIRIHMKTYLDRIAELEKEVSNYIEIIGKQLEMEVNLVMNKYPGNIIPDEFLSEEECKKQNEDIQNWLKNYTSGKI